MQPARSSRIVYSRSEDLAGLEAARFQRFTGTRSFYPRAEYMFAVTSGTGNRLYDYLGEQVSVPSPEAIIVQAGEPYTVKVKSPVDGLVLHIDARLFKKYGPSARLPQFPVLRTRDPALAKLIVQLHGAVMEGAPLSRRKQLLKQLITHAVRKHAEKHPAALVKNPRRSGLIKVREHMHAALERNVPLSELAKMSRMSVFQFVRAFRREMGMTPHAMLIHMRTLHARDQLRAGVSAMDAASSSGFSDSSHLVRHFKRVFHVTPGAYALSGNRNALKD